eukprot:COSAG06_NODE_1563_length_9093_cov_9.891495_9_plen_51_part_00
MDFRCGFPMCYSHSEMLIHSDTDSSVLMHFVSRPFYAENQMIILPRQSRD